MTAQDPLSVRQNEVSLPRADEVHSPYITATFLVPTNDAFAALLHSLGATKQQLLADPSM